MYNWHSSSCSPSNAAYTDYPFAQIASFPSLNVQLALVKLFPFQRSIDRLSLHPDSFFLVPQRTIATRQAVPLPTQHRQTISSPSTRTIASFPSINVQLPLVQLFPSQRRPSLRPENHRLFLVPQRTIATRQAVPLPTQRRPTISSPSKRTILVASFASLNVQLALVKLFPFQRSIARPSLRPENHRLFLVPQHTIATRQAVPLTTQHRPTIS
jgi:hypothetical protein